MDDTDKATGQAERFMWPGFLAKLRESFSLDPRQGSQGNHPASMAGQTPLGLMPDAAELRRLNQAVKAFPTREVANHLVDVCIEHGTDAFFYFDQAEFLSDLDNFYTEPTSNLRYEVGFVCLAHATFALGSQWISLEEPRKPKALGSLSYEEIGNAFYEQARSLIPDLDDSSSLQSVQAPFVLGVYLLPTRATASLHMYLGHALRKALALDLHVKSTDVSLSARDLELRSRLWWAVFSLDRYA